MESKPWWVAALSVAFLIDSVAAVAQPAAYIANRNDDSVSVIDTVTNTVTATIPVGDAPEALAVNPDDTRVYVANTGDDTVSVINVASKTVIDTIAVGKQPLGVAVSPSGFWVYVANVGDVSESTISVIDAASNTVVDTISVDVGARRAVVSAGGEWLYVTNGGSNSVMVIDTRTHAEVLQIPVGRAPAGLDVTPDRSRLYVANTEEPLTPTTFGTVSVIDTGSNAVIRTIDLQSANQVAVTPDGHRVYVAQGLPSALSAIDTATDTVASTLPLGFPSGAKGLAITPDGHRVYVAEVAADRVSVVDTATNTVVDTVGVGSRPVFAGKFISPMTLLFADRFESGGVAKWTGSVGRYASTLAVNGGSAYLGGFGLEVSVGKSCTVPVDLEISSPPAIQGLFLACNSITATGVQVTAPGATFATGSSIVLEDDFSVGTDAPFTATLDPGFLNGLGYVEWESASSLDSYNANFFLKLDNLSIAPGDLVELLNGYSNDGNVQFKVILKYNTTLMENRLVVSVRQDDGSYLATPLNQETLLPAGWNAIAVDWETGAGTGSLSIWVNGVAQVGVSGVDNDAQRIDQVRLGYVGGTVSTMSGSMALDDFWAQH